MRTEVTVEIPASPKKYTIVVREFVGSSFLSIQHDGYQVLKEVTVNTDALDAFCRKWVETHA